MVDVRDGGEMEYRLLPVEGGGQRIDIVNRRRHKR
jgi:hypothetical protein